MYKMKRHSNPSLTQAELTAFSSISVFPFVPTSANRGIQLCIHRFQSWAHIKIGGFHAQRFTLAESRAVMTFKAIFKLNFPEFLCVMLYPHTTSILVLSVLSNTFMLWYSFYVFVVFVPPSLSLPVYDTSSVAEHVNSLIFITIVSNRHAASSPQYRLIASSLPAHRNIVWSSCLSQLTAISSDIIVFASSPQHRLIVLRVSAHRNIVWSLCLCRLTTTSSDSHACVTAVLFVWGHDTVPANYETDDFQHRLTFLLAVCTITDSLGIVTYFRVQAVDVC
jgi:hypothetical protein